MANDQVKITELSPTLEYCRRYNGATYDDYDAEALSVEGTPQTMWGGATHVMYWGADSKFYGIGFDRDTAGAYGAITWEYWDSGTSSWQTLTPFHESTDGFTQNGYIAWAEPGGTWAATTVDGQSAYWVRASVIRVTTAATFYSMLRNLTLDPAFLVRPELERDRFTVDINGTIRKTDLAQEGPIHLKIKCHQPSLTYDDIVLLQGFYHHRSKLFVEDLAQTATPDPDQDAFYSDYTCYIRLNDGKILSPGKMEPDTYEIDFQVESANLILEF